MNLYLWEAEVVESGFGRLGSIVFLGMSTCLPTTNNNKENRVIEAKVIEDSISNEGKRLTTMQLVYPRLILAEVNTHRAFSRSSSSTRAIPTEKLADMALDEMVEPIRWGKNQAGMQAQEDCLEGVDLEEAQAIWSDMARYCAEGAKRLSDLGLHKQWAGRPLEWFSNIRTLISSTEWDNFFALRCHPAAQPEIQALANAMRDALNASTPKLLKHGEWHLPYVTEDERNDGYFQGVNSEVLRKISAARCCRVSYLKHDQGIPSIEDDLALCDKLMSSRPIHASPFEHVASPDVLIELSYGRKALGSKE